MSKFCQNCGSEVKDTDKNCPNCGAAVQEPEVKKEVKQEASNAAKTTTKSATNNTKLFAIIGGAVAALLVVILLIVALAGGGYKKPIDNFIKGMEKGNAKTMLKAFPDVMKEDLEDYLTDDELEDMKADLEDEFGKNIKITYKVLDKEKIDKDDLKEVQEDLEDQYEDAKKSKVKVTAGYKLSIKMSIKGKDDKDSQTITMKVYKIGGKWCMLSPMSL